MHTTHGFLVATSKKEPILVTVKNIGEEKETEKVRRESMCVWGGGREEGEILIFSLYIFTVETEDDYYERDQEVDEGS